MHAYNRKAASRVRRFFVFFSFLSFIHSSSFLQSSRDSDYNCTFVLENNEEIQNQVHISNETLSFSFFWIVPSLLVRAHAIISHLRSFTQLSWLLCRVSSSSFSSSLFSVLLLLFGTFTGIRILLYARPDTSPFGNVSSVGQFTPTIRKNSMYFFFLSSQKRSRNS